MKRYDESLPQIIVINREDFGDEFEEAILTALMFLMKTKKICHVYQEDEDIVVIEYAYIDPDIGEPYSAWLSDRDIDILNAIGQKDER